MTFYDIDTRYRYHRPRGDQPTRYESVRGTGKHLAQMILDNCPESQERDVALQYVEQAVMWANAAIARRSDPVNMCAQGPERRRD